MRASLISQEGGLIALGERSLLPLQQLYIYMYIRRRDDDGLFIRLAALGAAVCFEMCLRGFVGGGSGMMARVTVSVI